MADTDLKGVIYIISAPSGTGKTSLVQALLKAVPELMVSVSHTTRPQRPAERAGQDYYFVSETEFQQLIEQQAFLEYAKVFNHHYGSARQTVESALRAGQDVILEIDWQGARQIRKAYENQPDRVISIFIVPPSHEELLSRLTNRHRDNPEIVEARKKEFKQDLRHYEEYDYLICNDGFERALEDLKSIIQARRLKRCPKNVQQKNLISKLLT